MIMLSNILVRRLFVINEPGAPWHLADRSIIQPFVVLYHVFVRFCPLLVYLLILLVKFIIIGVSFVIELVNGIFLVPVFRGLKVTSTLLLAKIILRFQSTALSLVKVINVGCCGSSLLLHHSAREIIQFLLALTNLVVKSIDLSIYSCHPMLIHIISSIIIGFVQWSVRPQVQQVRHSII